MPEITEPTVLFDLDDATYHADRLCPERTLSSTMAKAILQPAGPARLRELLDNPPPRKKVFDFGSAAHEKVLGRGQPVVGIDGNRNATAVKLRLALAAGAAGKASRRRRTTGGSMVDDGDFTNSPSSFSLLSRVLLSTPSSFASS